MRVVIQRVKNAAVVIDGKPVASIGLGLLVLCAFHAKDTTQELDWMSRKLFDVRLFNDAQGKLNYSLRQINGEILIVSQFTLYGQMDKGTRPSFSQSAPYEKGEALYQEFLKILEALYERPVPQGQFGADMQVTLTNDGPVTLILDRDYPRPSDKKV